MKKVLPYLLAVVLIIAIILLLSPSTFLSIFSGVNKDNVNDSNSDIGGSQYVSVTKEGNLEVISGQKKFVVSPYDGAIYLTEEADIYFGDTSLKQDGSTFIGVTNNFETIEGDNIQNIFESLDTELSEIYQRLEKLEGKVDEYGNSITELTNNYNTLNSLYSNLNNSVISINNDITNLQNSIEILEAESGDSLWSESGSNIYYSGGRVGIGTTSPARRLDVNGAIRFRATAQPGTAVSGDIYNDGNNLWYYDGSMWVDLTAGGSGGTVTSVGTGDGLTGGPIVNSGSISVDAPTCAGTDKLQWTGTDFICSPDVDTDTDTTYTAGSGVALLINEFRLGNLTSDWTQTGGFDIVLSNSNSELRIMESVGGAFFGTIDVGDLTADRSYSLPDQSGTIALLSDIPAGITSFTSLTDTPATYAGANDYLVKVNAAGTGLEFVSQSSIDAGTLGGQNSAYYLNASNINAGTLNVAYYSAYSDLIAEGLLDNNAGTDILTRDQADSRYLGFSNVNTPGGTNPSADSYNDSLIFNNGSNISIIGDAGTDTITISASDQYTGTVTLISTGDGLIGGPISNSGIISIDSPTCLGTDKLQWSGTNFICSTDVDTNTTYTAGSGLTLVGTQFDLGAFTTDWQQTGGFDLVLANASSELRILESVGDTFYGTLDVTDLSADRNYQLPDQSGTLALVSDIPAPITNFTGLSDTPGVYTGFSGYMVRVNPGETGLEFVATSSLDSGTLDGIDSTGFFQIQPSLIQTANGTTPLLYVNETGAGTPNLIHMQTAGLDTFVVANNGSVQLGGATASAWLALPASTTSMAHLNLAIGADVTVPGTGDLWFNGSNLYFHDGSITHDLLAGATSLWQQNGSDIYYSAGNVGIGTSTPNEELTVEGQISLAEGIAPAGSAGYGKIYVDSNDSNLYYLDDNGESYKLNETKQLIEEFVVAQGENVTAGDIVSFLNGEVVPGYGNLTSAGKYRFNDTDPAYSFGNQGYQIVALDSNNLVITFSYNTTSNNSAPFIQVVNISGSTVTFGEQIALAKDIFGSTTNQVGNFDADEVRMARMDSNTILVQLVNNIVACDIAAFDFNCGTPVSSNWGNLFELKSLSSTKALAVRYTASPTIEAFVIDISGLTVSIGSPVDIKPSLAFTSWSFDVIDSSTAIVFIYNSTAGQFQAYTLDIAGTSITKNSNQVIHAGANSTNQIVVLDSTSALVSYLDKARILSISGSTITPNPEQTIPYGNNFFRYTKISSTEVVATWEDTGVNYANYTTISGTTITFNSDTVVEAAADSAPEVAVLSGTRIVPIFATTNPGPNRMKINVGDLTGTSFGFSLDEYVNLGGVGTMSTVALDSNTFFVAFTDHTDSIVLTEDDAVGYGIVGTVSGSTITYGNKVRMGTSASIERLEAVKLSATKVLVAYLNSTNDSVYTIAGSVSGTSITFGTDTFAGNFVLGQARFSLAANSSTSAVITYNNTARVITISGTSISYGSTFNFAGGTVNSRSITFTQTNRFVIGYFDTATNVIVGNVSGTNITYGTPVLVSSGTNGIVDVVGVTENKFVVTYHNNNIDRVDSRIGLITDPNVINLESATTILGGLTSTMPTPIDSVVSGSNLFVLFSSSNSPQLRFGNLKLETDNTLTLVKEGIFFNQYVSTSGVTLLDDQRVVTGFVEAQKWGTNVVAYYKNPTIGIAKDSGSGGDTVRVVIQGISEAHVGLIPGSTYYIDSTGALTTTMTPQLAGLALNSTDLLISSNQNNENQFFGDMVFFNDFRITEAQGYDGLLYLNQNRQTILTLNDNGDLKAMGGIMANSLNIADSFKVNESGLVGIGNLNPQTNLHIGDSASVPTFSGINNLVLAGETTEANPGIGLYVPDGINDFSAAFFVDSVNAEYGFDQTYLATAMDFVIRNNGIKQFAIYANGNVEITGNLGIGTGTPNSKLHVLGSFAVKRAGVNSDSSSDDEVIIAVTDTTSPRTITLLTEDMVDGRIVIIKDESGGAGTNNITVISEGPETIDGQGNYLINQDYGVIRLYTDGTNWFSF